MRELSSREKKLVAFLGVLIVFSVGWLTKDYLNLDLLGRELKIKQGQLLEAQALVALSKEAIQIGNIIT